MVRTLTADRLLVLVALAMAGCRPRPQTSVRLEPGEAGTDPPPVATSADHDAGRGEPDELAEATRLLPIPARAQAPESPPSGWCGETAIQEGLLYYGVLLDQRQINRAGHPAHPDLYAAEIPRALAALSVRFTSYRGARGYEPFVRWARDAIDAGEPVLAGVKIMPTEHPTWGLDHFVLIVGYRPRGVLVNTTWGQREWVADGETGLSLKGAFYGFRLHGVNR